VWDFRGQCRLLSHWRVGLQPVCGVQVVGFAPTWSQCQVRTVRWRLYQMAGKVVRHAGAVILKVQQWLWGLCEEIRTRWVEAAQT